MTPRKVVKVEKSYCLNMLYKFYLIFFKLRYEQVV